jgi:hypothetical protein
LTRSLTAGVVAHSLPEAKEALRFQAVLLDTVGQALIALDMSPVVDAGGVRAGGRPPARWPPCAC